MKLVPIKAELQLANVIVNRFFGGPLIQIFVTQCEYKRNIGISVFYSFIP